MCDGGLWPAPCFTSGGGAVVCDGGLWPAPCFTSGEGAVVGDVVKITMETKDGWSHSV